MAWRDSLLRLHVAGWNTDDIDEACEALHEACDEGVYEGTDVGDLTLDQAQRVLAVSLDGNVFLALRAIAVLRRDRSRDAEELQQALYDLDAFAYEFAGDD